MGEGIHCAPVNVAIECIFNGIPRALDLNSEIQICALCTHSPASRGEQSGRAGGRSVRPCWWTCNARMCHRFVESFTFRLRSIRMLHFNTLRHTLVYGGE